MHNIYMGVTIFLFWFSSDDIEILKLRLIKTFNQLLARRAFPVYRSADLILYWNLYGFCLNFLHNTGYSSMFGLAAH